MQTFYINSNMGFLIMLLLTWDLTLSEKRSRNFEALVQVNGVSSGFVFHCQNILVLYGLYYGDFGFDLE